MRFNNSKKLENDVFLQYLHIFKNFKVKIKPGKKLELLSIQKNLFEILDWEHGNFFLSLNVSRLERTKNQKLFKNYLNLLEKKLLKLNFETEIIKKKISRFLKPFVIILENLLGTEKGNLENVSNQFFRGKKNKTSIGRLITFQLKRNKENYWNFIPIGPIGKNDFFKKETGSLLINFDKNMEFYGNRCEKNLEKEKNFLKKKESNSQHHFLPSEKPAFFKKIFDLIITNGSKLVSKIFKTNICEINQAFRKKTYFNRNTDLFHFDLKKIGTIISFQQNNNSLKTFTSQHLVSICPVGKNPSGLFASLLPCCHLISEATQKKLIDFFLGKVYKKALIKCPCCQLRFQNNLEKKLSFD